MHHLSALNPSFILCFLITVLGVPLGGVSVGEASAASIEIIGEKTQVPENKESDWIYGDYLLQNEHLVAVIAQPKDGRNANMTVRGVGACVIDLTLSARPNDQLSAFYPTGGRFNFHDAANVRVGKIVDGQDEATDEPSVQADGVFWECDSSSALNDEKKKATVRYELRKGEPYLRVTTVVESVSDEPLDFSAYDGVRADKTFTFEKISAHDNAAYCADEFFGQTYGFVSDQPNAEVTWKSGRMRLLQYNDQALHVNEPKRIAWSLHLVPATSVIDLTSVVDSFQGSDANFSTQTLRITDDAGPVERAVVTFISDNKEAGTEATRSVRTGGDGIALVRLAAGTRSISIKAPGYDELTNDLVVTGEAAEHKIVMPTPACVEAKVTDAEGEPIPCKVTFYAADDATQAPNFGPDSASGSVVNCVYSVDGTFRRSIDPGRYEVIVSRGPEYDAVFETIDVVAGKAAQLQATLKRTVSTPGWISAELHSHSTPSGDNTSVQRGRVENLLCEHLEFAPCTEHNRITSYTPHLKFFNAEHLMATCTGMELTGNPLPVNHQNAFPLHHHPHTQDGGGPQTDSNPVVQIERLAMWDDGSDKVVQGNHPNIAQQFGDRDTDGKPDEGFRRMFGFMDVIEVHPPQAIFDAFDKPKEIDKNRMAQWMQLLNQGTRLPGVVNTDAHYNHHGSGWLRNWFESDTDDPAKISISEMIHAAEHGHIIMSTGPYMTVRISAMHQGDAETAVPGEDLIADDGACQIAVEVQCPNWLDVNRVQIFLNGRSTDDMNFERRTHPEMFDNGVVKFKQTISLVLTEDAHVIVAAIGEGLKLGRVMGEQYGEQPPCVVSNPIFVDLAGDGFDHNHDGLGIPLPGAKTASK
ncbi:MAG: CehA/McbA family metallohydrolase [Pirellulaceae bacterium]